MPGSRGTRLAFSTATRPDLRSAVFPRTRTALSPEHAKDEYSYRAAESQGGTASKNTAEPPSNESSPDVRIAQALEILRREPISVLSLDVFDTLLWRMVPEPVDAFVLLGRHLGDLGHLADHVTPALFARLRQHAEGRAREVVNRRTSSQEVSLEQVYQQLPQDILGGLLPETLAGLEVAFERTITFPDLEVLRLARLARSECGARIVLVSDTYFSQSQLRQLLDRESFADVRTAEIFTSRDHQVGKGTGLYSVVLEALGVGAAEVLHIGDHPDSDLAFATKQGMHTVHFPKYPPELEEVLQLEGLARSGDRHRRAATLDPVHGDFGLTAMRSKAVHGSGHGNHQGATRQYRDFGASVLGPVFTGFAEWLHHRAQEEGASTLFCLMREGEFLARLVNGARTYVDSPVVAQPLWLSRQMCSRASIFAATSEELSALLSRRRPPTLRALCDDLGIGMAQLPEVFTNGEGRLDDNDLWKRALDAIAAHPDVQALIVAKSAELRERLVTYFLRTVGPGTKRVVLADIGWGATIQAHLDKALAAAGVEVETLGLYLLTNEAVLPRMLDGVKADGYLAAGGIPDQAVRWIIRSPEIIEQICMTDVGTLADFTPDAEPVPGAHNQSPVQVLQRIAVQSGITGYQSQWGRYSRVMPLRSRSLVDGPQHLLLKSLLRFVVSPTVQEATMFRAWSHDENYGSKDAETVVFDEIAPLLRYMTPAQLLELPMSRLYWPFALAALHQPSLARAVTAVLDGSVPAKAFNTTEEREVRVTVDSLGILARLPKNLAGRALPLVLLSSQLSRLVGFTGVHHAVVRPTGGGLCFVRHSFRAPSIQGLLVEFPAGPGIVRVDRMSLSFSLRGRPDPVRVDIEWPQDFGQVMHARSKALAKNLLFGTRRSPQIAYRCPRQWDGAAYSVEVEVAFAWLPAAPPGNADHSQGEILRKVGSRLQAKLERMWRSTQEAS